MQKKEQNSTSYAAFSKNRGSCDRRAGLGIAGAGMQAITGNPMASPFTTGLSSAAAFWSGTYDAVLAAFHCGCKKGATVAAAFACL